uniref:Single-stranded DNA-binding protein WHY1, chloroplastic n=1 Tax=Ananas comosus var. bracteatus TaxID=296719 RepID=A0A6V7NU93_ANACO|nr:unnamed protein product [Ananas comosus var. bracteatus]
MPLSVSSHSPPPSLAHHRSFLLPSTPLRDPLLLFFRSKTLNLISKPPPLSITCRRSDYFGSPPPPRLSSRAPPPPQESPTSSFAGGQSPRVFVGYSIYKGKAALTVEPRAPEFAPLDSGAYKVSKEGFVLLQFAPSVGTRQYDWNRKQVFSLSVAEIGTIISLGAKDSCEFFHDPFKGRSEEGKIRKVLKAEPLPDGTGHFFNLSVQNRLVNVDESIYIPITKAEFAVLNSAFNFILPYLLGWHAFANAITPENTIQSNNLRSGPESEWGR